MRSSARCASSTGPTRCTATRSRRSRSRSARPLKLAKHAGLSGSSPSGGRPRGGRRHGRRRPDGRRQGCLADDRRPGCPRAGAMAGIALRTIAAVVLDAGGARPAAHRLRTHLRRRAHVFHLRVAEAARTRRGGGRRHAVVVAHALLGHADRAVLVLHLLGRRVAVLRALEAALAGGGRRAPVRVAAVEALGVAGTLRHGRAIHVVHAARRDVVDGAVVAEMAAIPASAVVAVADVAVAVVQAAVVAHVRAPVAAVPQVAAAGEAPSSPASTAGRRRAASPRCRAPRCSRRWPDPRPSSPASRCSRRRGSAAARTAAAAAARW